MVSKMECGKKLVFVLLFCKTFFVGNRKGVSYSPVNLKVLLFLCKYMECDVILLEYGIV